MATATAALSRTVRDQKILGGLKTGDPSLLFVLTVEQYKEKPTKSKFIAIYDLFITDSGESVWGAPMGEFDPTRREDKAILGLMKARVDWCRELRATAQSMNFISRIRSSEGRAVAMASEFDVFMEKGKIMGQVSGLLMESRDRSFEVPGWRDRAATAKKILKAAGFDIAKLGLASIPDSK